MPVRDVAIKKMLSDWGITSNGSEWIVRQFLYDERIIEKSPNRANLAGYKVEKANNALRERFFWHCSNGDCRREAEIHGPRRQLLVERFVCMSCGGSNDARELKRIDQIADELAINKLLVVGGTDVKFQNIRDKSPNGLSKKWDYVDGTKNPNPTEYKAKCGRADVIIIWSRTPLSHKVSAHFDKKGDTRVVKIPSTGIAALAKGIYLHLADSREAALGI